MAFRIGGKQNKIVFIYTTAGDESCNGTSQNPAYYMARQEGANNSVEFCANQRGWHEPWNSSIDTFSDHRIIRYRYGNVFSYCLKLPDGCRDGQGQNGLSIRNLYENQISLAAVDSSAVYHGWDDLTRTIDAIIAKECNGMGQVTINTADTNTIINPGDYPDNIYAARLALHAADTMRKITINLFREYCTADLPVNLNDKELGTEAAILSILDYERTEHGFPSVWDAQHISYTSRNYFRTIEKK